MHLGVGRSGAGERNRVDVCGCTDRVGECPRRMHELPADDRQVGTLSSSAAG